MARFVVVGLGRIGLRVLWMLDRLGHEVFGIGSTLESVEKARSLGLEAYTGDLFSSHKLLRKHGDPDVVVVALPGAIGYRALEFLIKEGYNIVDVSFFPEDPLGLVEEIEKSNNTVVVDAGIAPGLSNFLVGRGVKLYDSKRAIIYVGGISRKPSPPLGLAPTWSMEDLLEEYLRPARLIRNREIVTVDPLESETGTITVSYIGKLEYFPTDGLRTLLFTFPDMDEMIEYTLRWPGHLDFVKKLKSIGFLSDFNLNVTGCPVRPRSCLARLLEHELKGIEDLVVLVVEVGSRGNGVRYEVIVEPKDEWSAMSIATSAFEVASAVLLSEGRLPKGLVFPEHIALNDENARYVMRFIEQWGVAVTEQSL